MQIAIVWDSWQFGKYNESNNVGEDYSMVQWLLDRFSIVLLRYLFKYIFYIRMDGKLILKCPWLIKCS